MRGIPRWHPIRPGCTTHTVVHLPQGRDRLVQRLCERFTDVEKSVKLTLGRLTLQTTDGYKIIAIDRRRTSSDRARWTLRPIALISRDSPFRSHVRRRHLQQIELRGNLEYCTGELRQLMHGPYVPGDTAQLKPSPEMVGRLHASAQLVQ